MNPLLNEALGFKNETVETRRTLHGFAEHGFILPKTTALVKQRLTELGLQPQDCGKAGIVALIGNPEAGKTLLLRADMDALPMTEESGLDFAAVNGNCHSCGHDFHTSMLLAAAKILKAHESELRGCVKLMFQPAEEQLAGALDMLNDGLLDAPAVTAAMALHMSLGGEQTATGQITYCAGPANFSGDAVNITVRGKEAHGSTPEAGIDAILIASHIVLALQEVLAREISCFENCVVLVGKISGGTSCNTVAGSALLEVSVRATTEERRAALKARVKEIAEGTAATFRGEATVDFVYGIAPMCTDPALSRRLAAYAAEVAGADCVHEVKPSCGTEDFTAVAARVPSAYYMLGAGSPAQGCTCGLHHPAARFDEDALPIGAAVYANCALRYLSDDEA